jgi:predicted nicotinamide N-methyase
LLEGRLSLDSLADLLWFGIFDGKMRVWVRQWTLADGRCVKLLEDTHAEGSEGECAIWPAGLILARFLESQYAGTIAGKVVVELGAGAAVGAISAAAMGAISYATEHPAAMDYMKLCLGANASFLAEGAKRGSAGMVTAEELDWSKDAVGVLADQLPASIILAADCTYNPEYFDIFLKVLNQLTAHRGGSNARRIVLLSHDRDSVPSRTNHCENFIWGAKVQKTFQAEEIKWMPLVDQKFRRTSVQIFRLVRR